jgi:flavin-dependent dehydrogenase
VIVLEQSGELGKKACCTGIVSNECLRAFPQLGPAVRQDLSAARIFSPSGSSVRVSRSEPQAHALDRAALD